MSKASNTDIKELCIDYIVTKIREISESQYAASWRIDIEYDVWYRLQGTTNLLDEKDVRLLRAASDTCGGWVAWNKHVNDAVFVPHSEWQKMCDSYEYDDLEDDADGGIRND